MIDRTASQRVKRQRTDRIREGWQEVRVWVPTNQDAEDVRKFAASRRVLAEGQLHEITKEVRNMNIETEIAGAIAQQGSSDFVTPSGAITTLMTTLAERGDIEGFSEAFIAFARAKPGNALFVESGAPAKILNGYIFHHLNLSPDAFLRWERGNPAWGGTIKAALREPARFVEVVNHLANSIRQAGTVT